MSSQTIKIPLNQAVIPLVYSLVGRTVLSLEDIAARLPQTYGDRVNADYGNPQVIFVENVLPYAKGMYSVGYTLQAAAISPATILCDQAIAIRDAAENQYLFVPARGANYVFNPATNVWASVSAFTFSGNLVTRAYVNGRTIICYEKNRLIEYNVGTGLFTTLALTYPAGLAVTDVRGCANASNYLILFTDITIYWCSPLNLLDFSTIDQGAGQQTPTDIEGAITAVLPCPGGFIIYTTKNAIAATFTNNAAAPFVYKKINNCGGVASWERVTPDADVSGHYILGTNGLQKVSLSGAENFAPDATDFTVDGLYEYWDPVTKAVILNTSAQAFSTKLTFIDGRYLVISYAAGTTTYSAALIYDSLHQRWGKLRITHADAFLYPFPVASTLYNYDTLPGYYDGFGDDTYDSWNIIRLSVPAPKQGLAFLGVDGSIYLMSTSFGESNAAGVIVLGHIQQQHSRLVTVLEATLEGLKTTGSPSVSILPSQNGADRDVAVAMGLASSSGRNQEYHARQTAINFDVAIEGTFVLSTALVKVMQHGRR